jgi:hypothetical protein
VAATPNGDACTDDAACVSGVCHNNVCSECSGPDDCGGAACNDATADIGFFVCAQDLGATCTVGAECATGRCFPSLVISRCGECDGDGVAGGCADGEICQGMIGSYAQCVIQ